MNAVYNVLAMLEYVVVSYIDNQAKLAKAAKEKAAQVTTTEPKSGTLETEGV
jgi:hypothetical protein